MRLQIGHGVVRRIRQVGNKPHELEPAARDVEQQLNERPGIGLVELPRGRVELRPPLPDDIFERADPFRSENRSQKFGIVIQSASRLQCQHALHQPIRRRDVGRPSREVAPVAIHQFDQDGSQQLALHADALHFPGQEQIELQLQAVSQLADVELHQGRIGNVGPGIVQIDDERRLPTIAQTEEPQEVRLGALRQVADHPAHSDLGAIDEKLSRSAGAALLACGPGRARGQTEKKGNRGEDFSWGEHR